MANSAGIFEFPEAHFNMVRPGLSLYGYSYSNMNNVSGELKPVLDLSTKVISIRTIQKGDSVGYNRTFISDKQTRIATIPIGYGDGYPRHLTNLSKCLIKGKFYNLVGTICMDESMVDIGFDDINIGDDVILIGSQNGLNIGADNLAEISGTITYEILTSVSARVPRIYSDII
jgi:alanine racemase